MDKDMDRVIEQIDRALDALDGWRGSSDPDPKGILRVALVAARNAIHARNLSIALYDEQIGKMSVDLSSIRAALDAARLTIADRDREIAALRKLLEVERANRSPS